MKDHNRRAVSARTTRVKSREEVQVLHYFMKALLRSIYAKRQERTNAPGYITSTASGLVPSETPTCDREQRGRARAFH